MLEQGLLDEVQTLNEFAENEAAIDKAIDETRGIWVSIGYKEFKSLCAKQLKRGVGVIAS